MKNVDQLVMEQAPVADVQGSAMVHAGSDARQKLTLAGDLREDVSPGQLILAALEKGVSVDVIERLVALKERIEDRNAVKQFVQALARVKAKLPTILHSKTAKFTTKSGFEVKYSYTELDELAAVIDPILSEEGFTYSWDQRLEKDMNTTTCILQHAGGHSRSASFTLPTANDSAASPQQKIGIADTYAGRRALIAVLGLTTADKDPRPAEIDPTPASAEQQGVLKDMLKARLEGKTPERQASFTKKFLEHFGVTSLEKLRAIDYQGAVELLKPPTSAEAKP